MLEGRLTHVQVLPDEGTDEATEERELIAGTVSTLRNYFRGPGWTAARQQIVRRQEEIRSQVIRNFRLTPDELLTARATHDLLDQLLADPVKFFMKKGL